MNTAEIMRKADEYYDLIVADSITSATEIFRTQGSPTADEVADFVEWYSAMLAEDRAANLAKLRAWLSRNGEILH
jgi:hypothetical protein